MVSNTIRHIIRVYPRKANFGELKNMTITVKYFANIRDLVGLDEDVVDHRSGITVQGVWEQVKGELDDSTTFLAAINMEYSPEDTEVKDGDEVAFFPTVSGG